VPLSLLANDNAGVVDQLEAQCRRAKPDGSDGELLMWLREPVGRNGGGPAFERELFDALRERPLTLHEVHRIVEHPGLYRRYLDDLERQGVVLRSGFTPSDAAHVVGQYHAWNGEAAGHGATLVARRLGVTVEALCQRVLSGTARRVAAEVVRSLVEGVGDANGSGATDGFFVDLALAPDGQGPLRCEISLSPTLVAIGAPVETYFPMVRDMLKAKLRIPEHADVANAVGAVAGSVVSRVHVLVRPLPDDEGFRVHLPERIADFAELVAAVGAAEEWAREAACTIAGRAGAADIRVTINREDKTAAVASGWGAPMYLETLLTAVAVGRPRLATT